MTVLSNKRVEARRRRLARLKFSAVEQEKRAEERKSKVL